MIQQQQTVLLGPPGCGKTTSLLQRVEQELSNDVHPSRIAYVSFTRKAADEAVTRALSKFNVQRHEFPYFRTLHSLAYQQLGLSHERVMGAPHYKALGESLGLLFSNYMNYEEGLPVSALNGDQVLYIVGMARATLRPLKEQFDAYLSGEVSWWQVKQFNDTLTMYKRDSGMLDFSDMLDEFVINCDPLDIEVAIIDEAQDLSKQQWRMVRHAMQRARRVYIAGDDDQGIFSWSGADVDTFMSLTGERVVLDQSYRLPRTIHALCLRLASRIQRRYAKQWAPRDADGSIRYLASLADLHWQNEGSYLFLARNRYLLEQLEEYVRASGVPYSIGRRQAVDADAVAAIVTWERLRQGKPQRATDIRRALGFLAIGSGIKRGFRQLKGIADDATLNMTELREQHGVLRHDIWHDALERIPAAEREFYLAALRRGEKISRKPRVHISTIHGVKGGEADHVVLVSDMAGRTYNDYRLAPDAEHRVAYVAASRARQSLSILMPRTPRAYDYR